MEVEQQQITLQMPQQKRMRLIVDDEAKRARPPARTHITFQLRASDGAGRMALSIQGSQAGGQDTVSFNDFLRLLQEEAGLSKQVPVVLNADNVPINLALRVSSYRGEQSWPFWWAGVKCALGGAEGLANLYVDTHCEMEEGLGVLRSLWDRLRERYPPAKNGKELHILAAISTLSGFKWHKLSQRNKRGLDTVYLDERVKQDLVHQLERFTASSALYDQYGVVWKYCVLLSGPPGTGKTSLALALCSHFGWNIGKMAITPGMTSTSLEQLLQQLPLEHVILLEDVDALFTGREAKTGIDFSTLLNLLDGVATRRGLVLFMTTNHPERLDGALTRAGRVDSHVRFGQPGLEHKRQLLQKLGSRWLTEHDEFLQREETQSHSMAELQQHLFNCIKDERESLLFVEDCQ